MTYAQLTEAQQERACIIWEGEYGCKESEWETAINDAQGKKEARQEDAMNDETPWWLK